MSNVQQFGPGGCPIGIIHASPGDHLRAHVSAQLARASSWQGQGPATSLTPEVRAAIEMSERTGEPVVVCMSLVGSRAVKAPTMPWQMSAQERRALVLREPKDVVDAVRAITPPRAAERSIHMMKQSVSALGGGEFDLRDIRQIQSGEEIDPASAGVKLVGPAKWSDGSPVKLVWVQLAEVGAWKGHPSGDFEMTPKTFAEIKRNFERRGLPIQYDMDHYSELPTDQIDPQKGTPAQGWIHRLDNRGVGGLWGLTQWLDYAREGIKAGKFAFLSPAIRFDAKDGVTGAEIGARLTSVAITGQPFLTGIGQLRAAKDERPKSFTALTAMLMSDKGLGWADAQAEAARIIKGGK